MDVHLQVDFVHSGNVVRHPAEDEATYARSDADTQEQNFFIGFWSKTLLHVLHLWGRRQERDVISATQTPLLVQAGVEGNYVRSSHRIRASQSGV